MIKSPFKNYYNEISLLFSVVATASHSLARHQQNITIHTDNKNMKIGGVLLGGRISFR